MCDVDDTPPAPDCENCGQDFDVSLPDTDDHWYECAGCDAVICFDCKNMDAVGEDWCPTCVRVDEQAEAHHDRWAKL